jgi:hypothetical protein
LFILDKSGEFWPFSRPGMPFVRATDPPEGEDRLRDDPNKMRKGPSTSATLTCAPRAPSRCVANGTYRRL